MPSLLIFTEANSSTKSTECYLGLLYAIEDVAVYGYMTPLKVKIVLALGLSDTVVRDVEIATVRFVSYVLSFDDIHPCFPGFQGITHGVLFIDIESFLEVRRTKCGK
jgi:hypothetical protein